MTPEQKKQIAEKLANEYHGGRIRVEDCILSAINEASTPQVDWAKAVEWPTRLGLWYASNGGEAVLAEAYVGSRDRLNVSIIGSLSMFARDEQPGWRFVGPITIPLPAAPSPPAYVPKVGEFFWWMVPATKEHGVDECVGVSVERVRGIHGLFALASHEFAPCSPPAEIGGDS